MRHLDLCFDDGDVRAISCALAVLPAYDSFESLPQNLVYLPASIIRKMSKCESLNGQEIYLIAVAVDCAYKALRGEISIEDEAVRDLRPHFFTINKLHPRLSVLLDSEE